MEAMLGRRCIRTKLARRKLSEGLSGPARRPSRSNYSQSDGTQFLDEGPTFRGLDPQAENNETRDRFKKGLLPCGPTHNFEGTHNPSPKPGADLPVRSPISIREKIAYAQGFYVKDNLQKPAGGARLPKSRSARRKSPRGDATGDVDSAKVCQKAARSRTISFRGWTARLFRVSRRGRCKKRAALRKLERAHKKTDFVRGRFFLWRARNHSLGDRVGFENIKKTKNLRPTQ